MKRLDNPEIFKDIVFGNTHVLILIVEIREGFLNVF